MAIAVSVALLRLIVQTTAADAAGPPVHVSSWGTSSSLVLGCGSTAPCPTTGGKAPLPVPVNVPVGVVFTKVSASTNHALALGSDGKVYAWGANTASQVTDPASGPVSSPLAVTGLEGATIVDISTGQDASLALDANGNVWSWGSNGFSQQGCTASGCGRTPHQIAGLSNITAIQGAGTSAFALDGSGQVWAWGRNFNGALGIGASPSSTATPLPVQQGATRFTRLAAPTTGLSYTLAVDDQGRLWSWGCVFLSAISCPSTQAGPITVPMLHSERLALLDAAFNTTKMISTAVPANIVAVAAGRNHDLLLTGSGQIYELGSNVAAGATGAVLGGGGALNGSPYSGPVLVDAPGVVFEEISAGFEHSMAVSADRALYSWGNNRLAVLGLGASVGGANRPTVVPNLPPVVAMDAAEQASFASTNFAPVAVDDEVQLGVTQSTADLAVLANDSDQDGDSLQIDGVSAPSSGATATIAGGAINYVAAPGFCGTDQLTYTVTDGIGSSNVATVTITIPCPDRTPPDVAPTITGPEGANGWYTGPTTVTWTITDPESTVTTTGCDTVELTTDTAGTDLTCTATGEGGTTTSVASVRIDSTAPVLAPTATPSQVVVGGSIDLQPNATDPGGSGIATASCEPADVSTAGARTVSCTATDLAGNTATATVAYTVVALPPPPPAGCGVRHCEVKAEGAVRSAGQNVAIKVEAEQERNRTSVELKITAGRRSFEARSGTISAISRDRAVLTGQGSLDRRSGYTYRVELIDARPDTVDLTVLDANGAVVWRVTGTLSGRVEIDLDKD